MSHPLNKPGLSRRDFLVGGAAVVAGAAAASCLPDVDGRWPPDGGSALCSWSEPRITPAVPAAPVVEVTNTNLVQAPPNVKIVEAQVRPTLKELLGAITGETEEGKAWQRLLGAYTPGQVVGIKVNTLNAKVPTHPEIVRELVLSLKMVVAGADIVVWDRRLDELARAGFTESYIGCRVVGTQDDPQSQGNGPGYEAEGVCFGSERARLSRLITRPGKDGGIDHLINFAVLKNHLASGFTGVLKNHYGTFHNPGTFHDRVDPGDGHVLERRFEQAIPTINAVPEVAKKSRLWLVDGTIVVAKGDTDSAPDTLLHSIFGSLDPVALDTHCRDARNKAGGGDGDSTSDGWLKACERVGLGKASGFTLDSRKIG